MTADDSTPATRISATPPPHAPPGEAPSPAALRLALGETDIYLLDQLLRGRIEPGMAVLDAGCGPGRNVHYLLQAGFEVCAVDQDPERIATFRARARQLAPGWPADNARVAELTALPFEDGRFDVVIAIAVLHFAADAGQFRAGLDELWRVIAPGGLLFTRLASSIGLEDRIEPLGNGRFHIPDGTDRFLVDEPMLLAETARLGATLLDPIKTVNVQGKRCMTTWVLGRGR